MRLDIRYRMHFRYAEPVHESQNEVRMRPRDDDNQRVLFYRLISYPPVRLLHTFDYWGTAVDHLCVRSPHTEFELMAETTVETSPRPAPPADIPVDALENSEFCSENHEFLVPSRHVQWHHGDAVTQHAEAAASEAGSVTDTITSVTAETRRLLSYERGVTEIGVSLADLLAGGAGVCQDFAHLAIGMLRSVGVPARYVSGYLFAVDETAHIGPSIVPCEGDDSDATATSTATTADTTTASDGEPTGETAASADTTGGDDSVVIVQTHAWIAAAVPGWGWWMLDPTNGTVVGERHVMVGHGRDYGDVPPVRGAFMGPEAGDLDAEVVIGKQDADDIPSSGERFKLHALPHIVVQPRTATMRPMAVRRNRNTAKP